MASSILSGDRRWASARKSGMTVLGKVPKPINLPSQRSENNGLDPNVEIVTKGAISWGQKSSSGAPNAWASSSLLSKTIESTGSPNYGSGRPSSGGNGTRPSTASSDRSQDPSHNVWGPNSRPSSASGLQPSNHTPSVTSRPRSAETRQGSSQLSRFAEVSAEPAVAWVGTRTIDKLGTIPSRISDFTLTSGDFPTLGSEKTSEAHIQRDHSSQGRPSSSSGMAARTKESLERPMTGDSHLGDANISSPTTDKDLCARDVGPSNMKTEFEHQQAPPYSSTNVRTGQIKSWHGPPVHPTDGIWYKGGPTGGPYRPSGPTGSFHVDPFVYYPCQFPLSSESVPRLGAGQGIHRPTNGESYRPRMPPNSYIVPGHAVIPARPGTYPGPGPYDNYYNSHQARFSCFDEKVPFVGVASQPGCYNRYRNPNENLSSGLLQTPPGGQDSQMAKEQMFSDTAQSFNQAPYKFLLKQHDGGDDNHSQEVRRQQLLSSSANFNREQKAGGSKQKGKQPTDATKKEMTEPVKLKPDYQFPKYQRGEHEGQASHPVNINSEEFQDISSKVSDGVLSSKPSKATLSNHERQHYSATGKNASLIEKIEGLNNKLRSGDSRNEVGRSSLSPGKSKLPKISNAKLDHSREVVGSGSSSTESAPPIFGMVVPDSFEVNASSTSNNAILSNDVPIISGPLESQVIGTANADSFGPTESAHFHVQRKAHVSQSRADHARSSSNSQVNGGWTKQSSGSDFSVTSTKTVEGCLQDDCQNCYIPKEAVSKESYTATISGSFTTSSEALDYKAQRAKLKELAAERAKQLQKEEEERKREQKAKALAKLEELNRRSAAQSLNNKSTDADPLLTDNKLLPQDEAGTTVKIDVVVSNASDGTLIENTGQDKQQLGDKNENLGALTAASNTLVMVSQDSSISCGSSLSLYQETNATEVITEKICLASDSHDSTPSRLKQMGYRRKPKVSQEKISGEKSFARENMETTSSLIEASHESSGKKPVSRENMDYPSNLVEVIAPASVKDEVSPSVDPSMQHKKKSSRNSKNKNKIDETTVSSTVSSSSLYTENLKEHLTNNNENEPTVSEAKVKSAPSEGSILSNKSQGSNDVIATSSEQGLSKGSREGHVRMRHQWRTQSPRTSWNPHGIRPMDKFHENEIAIWAPVKAPNKIAQSEESGHGNLIEDKSHSSQKNDQNMHNGTKTKRADMERYVAKPVAKELLQHENMQQPSLSIHDSTLGDISGKPDFDPKKSHMSKPDGPSVGKTEIVADAKSVEDNKPTRCGRGHASWRERGSSESTSFIKSSNGNLRTPHASEPFKKPSDQHISSKFDTSPEKKMKSEVNNHQPSSEPVTLPVVDHGAISRQRSEQMKVQRVAAGEYRPAGDRYLQNDISNSSEINNPDFILSEPDARDTLRAENKNPSVEHVRNRWKPRSHPYANNQQQGNGQNGGEKVASHGVESNKEIGSQGMETHPLLESGALTQRDSLVKIRNKKSTPSADSSELTRTSNHDMTTKELAPVFSNTENQHQVSPRPRHHGQQTVRLNRAQETTYRRRDQGKNSINPTSGDVRKNNTHLEYQPIGSFDKPSNSHSSSHVGQETQEAHHEHTHRYRERGQTQPNRNGHFFRRNYGAAVNVDDSSNSRE